MPRDNQRLKTVYPFLRRRPQPETATEECNCTDTTTIHIEPAASYRMQSELSILSVAGFSAVYVSDFIFFQFSSTTVRNA